MNEGVVDEDCPASDLRPQSPYAESKLRAERLLTSLGREDGLRFITCRLGTVFGVSPGMRFHTAINKFCWQAAQGEPMTAWRTAISQQRPYLEIGDAVAALSFVVRRAVYDGQIYNVATLNASIDDVISEIKADLPDAVVRLVDSPIMNQLSYRVSSQRFMSLGFRFCGRLRHAIGETLKLLEAAGGRTMPRLKAAGMRTMPRLEAGMRTMRRPDSARWRTCAKRSTAAPIWSPLKGWSASKRFRTTP